MREILFRGKHRHKDVWVFGDLLHDFARLGDSIRQGGEYCETGFFPVIPETVGQFTGLTDKNGTKIFEGDILRNEKNMVYAGSYNFECIFENAAFVFLCEKYGVAAYSDDAENLEIIGNIHDNPELSEQNYEKEKQEE